MKKITYILCALALCVTGASAQSLPDGYTGFLARIADRSPQATAIDLQQKAAARGFRTGLAPVDPEVELEYYFSAEKRYEITLSQSFDFPTVYHQRNKISKLSISRSEQERLAARRALMANISDQYLALNYAEARIRSLSARKAELEQLRKLYEKSVQAGQHNAVELQSSVMMLTEITTALASAEAERTEAAAALEQFNGGDRIPALGYPSFSFSGTSSEFVSAALGADYELNAAALDTLIAERTLKMSRNEWIPKLKVGYKLEMEGTQPGHALVAGISLPLWQNSGKVRHAKALGAAASAQHTATEAAVRARLNGLYGRYSTLSGSLNGLPASDGRYPELLRKSMEAGNLSAINYLLALSEWYSMEDSRMELEYQTAVAGATMSICLQ